MKRRRLLQGLLLAPMAPKLAPAPEDALVPYWTETPLAAPATNWAALSARQKRAWSLNLFLEARRALTLPRPPVAAIVHPKAVPPGTVLPDWVQTQEQIPPPSPRTSGPGSTPMPAAAPSTPSSPPEGCAPA
jgi:hypothetical protein